jgi:hypothetical protein
MISDSGPAGQCLKLAGAFPLVFLCLVLVNQRDYEQILRITSEETFYTRCSSE